MIEFRKCTNSPKPGYYIALAALCLVLILFSVFLILNFPFKHAVIGLVQFGSLVTMAFALIRTIDPDWLVVGFLAIAVTALLDIVP